MSKEATQQKQTEGIIADLSRELAGLGPVGVDIVQRLDVLKKKNPNFDVGTLNQFELEQLTLAINSLREGKGPVDVRVSFGVNLLYLQSTQFLKFRKDLCLDVDDTNSGLVTDHTKDERTGIDADLLSPDLKPFVPMDGGNKSIPGSFPGETLGSVAI